jgi:hypothetical protein
MTRRTRVVVEWTAEDTVLSLVEPSESEIRANAPLLAEYYNEPINRALMTNDHEFDAEDVVAQFESMREEGGRPFLLFERETLLGDSDLRCIESGSAEIAILIGARARQARG